ncbi:MAG TPA: hypothetical protein VJT72_18045 [Pseudonocardiaceae bacterium]|nr:hypothetical protein [Pseudonocardiaceae bacterium]
MGQLAQGLRRWQAVSAAAFSEVDQPVGPESPTTGIAGFSDGQSPPQHKTQTRSIQGTTPVTA